MPRHLLGALLVLGGLLAAGLLLASRPAAAHPPIPAAGAAATAGPPALTPLASGGPASLAMSAPAVVPPPPTPTIPPPPPPLPCGTNVVANSGFESGGFAPWVVDNSAPAPFIAPSASGYPVHGGSAAAHVGFLPRTDTGGDSSFAQTLTVPPEGGTLAYWYWPRTADSLTYDWQDASVQTPGGVTLATIMHVCSNAQTWTPVSFDLAPYAGQTVRLQFLAHGDGAGDATDMFVDDVQLLTPACPTATPTATGTPTSTATRTPTPTATPTCAPAGQYRILLVHGDPSRPPTTLRTELLAQPGVSGVDLFDATHGTPTLAQLQQYPIVVPYLDYAPADAVALGNVLADYIDAGGVVVASSLWSTPGPIAGRYVSGGYSPYLIPAASFTDNRVLGAYTAAHPLMAGVTSLATAWGTTASLAPGAVLVAAWTTGEPLLATQTVNGHTSVGFTAYLGDYATHFGDWARLIVNAGRWLAPPPCAPPATSTPPPDPPTATPTCSPAGQYRILLVHGDPQTPPATLRTELLAQPGVSAVDLFDDTSGTPTLALLQQYQIVVPYLDYAPADAVALGNVLADYIDSGGVVVASSMWAPPWPIAGRYISGGYSPYLIPATTFSNNHALGAFSAAHPLMAGVSTLVVPLGNVARLAVGATLVAAWTDGQPLLATQTVSGHTSVGLTAYLGDLAWHVGDFARVIVNAGRWLAPPPCLSTATATTTPTGTATSPVTATSTATDTPAATGTSRPNDTPAATHTPSSSPTETPTASPPPSFSPTAPPGATNTPPPTTGHVTWQGRPAQPDPLQALPLSLTLTLNGTNYEFAGLTTDASGTFTATTGALPAGTYAWRVKGPQYLATAGTVDLGSGPRTTIEMGLQLAGDANNDNLIDILDFGVLRGTFGRTCGDPGFDGRADFTGDCLVDILDFSLLRANFGQSGTRPVQAPPRQGAAPPGRASLEWRPQGAGPANGATVHVGDRFTLDLWVNAPAGTGVIAQQSDLSFPADKLHLGAPAPAGATVGTADGVTPDGHVLEVTLQNAVCNGPRACASRGGPLAAGFLAFASGTLRPPPGTGPFRVGSVTVQATAPGLARLHWLRSPPAPAGHNTRIVTEPAGVGASLGPVTDYVLEILPTGQ